MRSFMDDDVIIIKAPTVERIPPPTLHSAFNLLNKAMRASLAGNLTEGREEFSRRMTYGPHWKNDKGVDCADLYLKAPGTDFYLPSDLSQFSRSCEKIIDYHYNSGKSSPWNRDGSEYCYLMATQHLELPAGGSHTQILHLDMYPHEVIEHGAGFNDDRYVMSDHDEMNTIFCDVDLGLREEDLIPGNKDYWNSRVENILKESPALRRTFSAFDIVHFNSTTGHARGVPGHPLFRTFLTLGFGAGYAPTKAEHKLNNPWLEKAIERQGRVVPSLAGKTLELV